MADRALSRASTLRPLRLLVAMASVGALLTTQATVADAATVERLAGPGRVETAVEVSRDAFPGGADVAVLVSSEGFADALSAAPLAGAESGPVLLNPPGGLAAAVSSELQRLDPSTVIVMGGENAQGQQVVRDVEAQGRTVVRLAGSDRYATAAAGAQRAVDRWLEDGNADAGREVIVALGSHPAGDHRAWPDALAAGVLAGLTQRPLLLIEQGAVPKATLDAMRELGTTRAVVVGGTGAIPEATARELGVPFTRVAGQDRYGTGVALVDAAVGAGADPGDVTVVTGRDYPDALGAVAAVLARGGVLLLIDGLDLDLSAASRDWLVDRAEIDRLVVVGGERVIPEATVDQIEVVLDGPAAVTLTLQPVVAADTALAIRSDHLGRIVFAERSGRVRVAIDGSAVTLLDIRSRVATDGERGLLDLQLHPDYATNRRFFVHYSDNDGDTVLSEFTADQAGTGTVGGESVLYRTDQPARNHNGGGLQFLPDGTVLLALGDGGGSNDQFGNGQNIDTPLGSLLRFDVATPGTARAPADNPYVGRAGNDFIWASGLRNPFRISHDGPSGVLYTADVGQGTWEEVNAVRWDRAGLDYGWSTMEGPDCFQAVTCNRSGLAEPVAFYDHGGSRCSITGGHVHRGSIGALRGHYFYGDYCSGQIFSFLLVDGEPTDTREWTADLRSDEVFRFSLFTFGIDGAGDVYVANGSQIYRIVEA